jgi:hypothetical protein
MTYATDQDATNVLLLCDDGMSAGLFATMNSVISNCATPLSLHFYIGLDAASGSVEAVAYTLSSLFKSSVRDITVVDVRSVTRLVVWYDEVSKLLTAQRTANIMNYARFFVADMVRCEIVPPRRVDRTSIQHPA